MRIDEFLLARIAEDEAVARDVSPLDGAERFGHYRTRPSVSGLPIGWSDQRAEQHFARWDPARVLAECAAKRAIVEQHRPDVGYIVLYAHRDREAAEAGGRETMPVFASAPQNPACLRALAAVYADHPDYQPEWAA